MKHLSEVVNHEGERDRNPGSRIPTLDTTGKLSLEEVAKLPIEEVMRLAEYGRHLFLEIHESIFGSYELSGAATAEQANTMRTFVSSHAAAIQRAQELEKDPNKV